MDPSEGLAEPRERGGGAIAAAVMVRRKKYGAHGKHPDCFIRINYLHIPPGLT
jgi:hypothetical protein